MRTLNEIAMSPLMVALYVAAFLLLIIQIFVIVIAFRYRPGAKYTFISVAGAVIWLIAVTLLLDGIYTLDYLPYKREYLAPVNAVYSLPWIVLLIAEVFSFAVSAVFIAVCRQAARRRPSDHSVKQTMDFLPVGICVAREDGSVLLSNLKMNEISEKLTGRPVVNFSDLLRAAEGGETTEDGRALVKCDGAFWVFAKSDLSYNGSSCVQLIVEDQTEQYRTREELAEKQVRLRDLQYRLKAYRAHEDDLMMKQEILQARATVHTQLGGALLAGKYYFEHPEKVDETELLDMMRRINKYLLCDAEDPEGGRDVYAESLKMAERIGVAVTVVGDEPKDDVRRTVAGRALEECAANAVKHAGGDALKIVFSDGGFVITNNGEAPKKEITETGGLLSLRRCVEEAGGVMSVSSVPEFSLTVRL